MTPFNEVRHTGATVLLQPEVSAPSFYIRTVNSLVSKSDIAGNPQNEQRSCSTVICYMIAHSQCGSI